MIEIPKNECEGCADRDRIIETLSRRIDELEREEILEVPTEDEMRQQEFEAIHGTY